MAIGLNTTTNAEGGDFLPLLQYDARAGRLFLNDRKDTGSGFETIKTDITNKQFPFAIDFLSCEVGWAKFTQGAAPVWSMVPLGKPLPDRPAEKSKDSKTGKERFSFNQCFRAKVGGRDIGGIREFAGSAKVFLAGIDLLHTAYEAAPEAAQGKIPVVKLVDSLPITSSGAGQSSTNYQPVFEIVGWADRPEKLGPATVPLPTSTRHVQTPQGVTMATTPQAAPPPVTARPQPAGVLEDAIPFHAEFR